MKSRFTALAVLPMLSLLSAATMGAEIPLENIDVSANGTAALAGELKNQNACRDGTYFKNFTPGLTNGSDGGSSTVDIVVDGKLVPLTIEWGPRGALPENSFGFSLDGAYALEVGVTTNTNNFTYNYRSLNATTPVQSDSNLNKLREDLITAGEVIADVNHLDLCLAALDDEAPSVSITEPTNGGTVSGNVTIVATITDNEGLDSFEINIVSVPGGVPVDESLIVGPTISGTEYTWSFDSSGVDVGLYLITVAATDTSILANVGTAEVTVEVVRSIANCLGILDGNDLDPNEPPDPFGGGCNPTGEVTVQAAPDINLERCNAEVGEVCSIGGELLEADPMKVAAIPDCDACGVQKSCGPGAFPDPRMMYDAVNQRWLPNPNQIRDLNVFEELGGAPDPLPANVNAPVLVLDKYTYGYQGCFGVAYHFKNFQLVQAYDAWPQNPLTGLAFVKTYFPEDTWEQLDRPVDRPVAKCYGPGPDGTLNLQEAAEFGYQTTDKQLMVERNELGEGTAAPWTETCGSGRTLTRNKSFDIWNIIETAGIDFESPTGPEDVLAFKFQRAEAKFAALFTALDNARPTLLTGKYSDVSSPVDQAKRRFDNGNPRSLGQSIGALEDAADAIRTKTTWQVTEENWPGDALGRISNLIWRLTKLREELTRLESLGN